MCRIIYDMNKKYALKTATLVTLYMYNSSIYPCINHCIAVCRCRYWVDINTINSCVGNLLEKLEHFIVFRLQLIYANEVALRSSKLLPWGENPEYRHQNSSVGDLVEKLEHFIVFRLQFIYANEVALRSSKLLPWDENPEYRHQNSSVGDLVEKLEHFIVFWLENLVKRLPWGEKP